MGSGRCVVVLPLFLLAASPCITQGAAEVAIDRDFLAGLVGKLPAVPFQKAGHYRGTAQAFRLVAIEPKGRRLVVACEVVGEYRPPVAGAVRRALTPPGAGVNPAVAGMDTNKDDVRWKAFAFDVRASVRAEPGPEGAPRFAVDVEEVKRRELEGMAGALARALGRHFDRLVTQVADGKAALLNARLNDRLAQKIAAFKEFGVLREIGYEPDRLVLIFDVTRYRAEGIAAHVFSTPRPGTVPLYRWVRPRLGDHYYTTRPDRPPMPAYLYEGIACHVLPVPGPGTVPLHVYRGPRERLYTTAGDQETRLARLGYRPEAVACHVYPVPTPGTVPLYQFVDPRTGVHFLTTHPHAEFAK